MSCTQILYDVLDYHQDLYYQDAKRTARSFALCTGLLTIDLVYTFLFSKEIGSITFFFLGIISGIWISVLIDAIISRRVYAAYLRYRLEVECDAYSEEAKR